MFYLIPCNKATPLIVASAALLVLNGCSDSASSSAAALDFITISGVTASYQGTYVRACHDNGDGTSNILTDVVSGTTLTETTTDFAGSTTCSTTGIDDAGVTVTLSATLDTAITGWKDAVGAPVAGGPTTADGLGPIGDTVAATSYTMTFTGGSIKLFFVVDDTGTAERWYKDNNFDGGELNAVTEDFFTKQ